MKYYFAPMEGVTGYIYRKAYRTYFDQIDKYFTPFIAANQTGKFKSREKNDILPENNQGSVVIPQILTNNANYFIRTAKMLKDLGYDEVNLNLGCPSGTVVSKGKGSGFLAEQEKLDAFLEEIFSNAVTKVSIKTRLGRDNPDEFYELIEIFNKYSMSELIIHPRIQKDFYKNKPNRKVFEDALTLSKNILCYNGDIFEPQDYKDITKQFPTVDRIMLGRGLISNPGLIHEIITGEVVKKETLKAFHDMICEGYQGILSGDRDLLFKMKEVWFYMIRIFTNSEKHIKKIRKAESLFKYLEAVNFLFQEEEILSNKDIIV